MQSSNIPSKIPLPFAYAASSPYVNPIPTASQIGVTPGRASLHDGFPPLTFDPIGSGGVPPFGGDMNGILNEITAIQQWQEAGGFFTYDSGFSTAIGGYPKGAVLQSTTFLGFWTSTAENNTSNPDAGGAGWIPTSFQGLQPITVTGGTISLSNSQAAYPIIVLSGTLTSNAIVNIPAFVTQWIFVNNTTGSYTVQLKTSGGTGVNLAQGYSSFVYGDGTNIYYANSASVTSFNGRTGAITLNATDVTNALGYTPYNSSNPAGYSAFGTNWTDVTGSRTNNVTYTNTTGKLLAISVSFTFSSGYDNGIAINGLQVVNPVGAATNGKGNIQAIVPVGGTYVVNNPGWSPATIDNWIELR